MTLPAINLINLNLSRILERASEIGVRRAFGARRGTLLGQFLVENIVLTFVGGILGLFFSALVLEAASISAAATGQNAYPFLPVRSLCRISYDTRAIVGEITCPTLVVHSPDDDLVPYKLGKAVYAASGGEPKTFLDIKGTHNEGVMVSGKL